LESRWIVLLALALAHAASGTLARAEDVMANGSRATAEVQQAADFLKGLPREWSGTSDHDCKTYEDKNIEKLSRSFAASAGEFLRSFVAVHGAVTITSAYRSAEEQECVCIGEKGPCAGRPRVKKLKKGKRIVVRSISHHQLGIALDVRPGTGSEYEFICLQEFAQLNPQFGVRFPFGKHDYPHMEPAVPQSFVMRPAALGAPRPPPTPCKMLKIMLTDEPID
jgi:hypothetical protein